MLQNEDAVKSKIQNQIDDYLTWCRDVRGFTESTIYGKTWMLRRFAEDVGIASADEITNEAVDCFISKLLKEEVNELVVNCRISVILAFTKWIKEAGRASPPLIAVNVKKLKGNPKKPRVFYTREQIEKVLSTVEDEMTWLVIAIGFDTGMRLSELANLQTCNIHGSRLNFLGKGKKIREVWLSARTSARLHEWLEKEGAARDWVWDNGHGFPYSDESLREKMKAAFAKAGYPEFHPHALRHSFATDIQKQGADVMEICEMMGHSNVATTQRYLHGFEGKMQGLFAKYRDPKIADLSG
jgi:integrase/recombinase XerC